MKTSELIGPALDWAVAKAEGLPLRLDPMDFRKDAPDSILAGWWVWDAEFNMLIGQKRERRDQHDGYAPSIDWNQGGPIIEDQRISTVPLYQDWEATLDLDEGDALVQVNTGPTPLIAAMRCFVQSRLGDEVDIPKELL